MWDWISGEDACIPFLRICLIGRNPSPASGIAGGHTDPLSEHVPLWTHSSSIGESEKKINGKDTSSWWTPPSSSLRQRLSLLGMFLTSSGTGIWGAGRKQGVGGKCRMGLSPKSTFLGVPMLEGIAGRGLLHLCDISWNNWIWIESGLAESGMGDMGRAVNVSLNSRYQ